MATFTVVKTDDAGPGSLRDAITAANATTDADAIAFNIPGSGVHTISVATELPAIVRPTTIDGWTQPGFTNKPLIELTTNVDIERGLFFYEAGADGSVLRGLVINNFARELIRVDRADSVRIQANYLGSNAAGNATVGSASYADVFVYSSTDAVIGTDGDGVQDDREGNLIVGSAGDGVQLYYSDRTTIAGNYIGTNAANAAGLGNGYGVQIYFSCDDTVIGSDNAGGNYDYLERNVIANSTNNGIGVREPPYSRNTRFSRNLVYGSGKLDIDVNEDGPHGGPVAAPTLKTVQVTGSSVVITGELHAIANSAYRLEFFAASQESLYDFGGAEKYLGAKTVNTDADGNATYSASFPTTLPPNWIVTATASGTAGTSEFAMDLSTAPNSPPQIKNYSAAKTYVEDAAPLLVFPSSTWISDSNSRDFNSGQLSMTITENRGKSDSLDVPSVGNGPGQFRWESDYDVRYLYYEGNRIGFSSYSATGVVIHFTSYLANPVVVSKLVRAIAFSAYGDTPETAPRRIDVQVTDGDGGTSNHAEQVVGVRAINDPPRLIVTDFQATARNQAAVIRTNVEDLDAGEKQDGTDGQLELTVAVSKGVYTIDPDGLTFVAGTNGTSSFTVRGTLPALRYNLYFGKFTPEHNYVGAASLKLTINDLGNKGDDGPKSATATVAINVYWPTVVVDNGWKGYAETGDWDTSSLAGYNNSTTRYSKDANATATWTAALPQAGNYKVEIYRVAHPGSATSARVSVGHAGSVTTSTLNFTGGTSGFVDLGTFYFDSGDARASGYHRASFVQLYQLSGDTIRADAVRFTRV